MCVYYILDGKDWKFCKLSGIEGKFFATKEDALQSLMKPRTIADEVRDNQAWRRTSERENSEEYVLICEGQYLLGFHERKFYDSELPLISSTKRSSTYAVSQVPDFTGELNNAVVFYSKESAEKMTKEIEEQAGYSFEIKLKSECI